MSITAWVFVFALWPTDAAFQGVSYIHTSDIEECQHLVSWARTSAARYAQDIEHEVHLVAKCVDEDDLVKDSI